MSTKLAKLETERSQIKARRKRRRKADERDQERLHELRELIHRERLLALVGVPGAVKVAVRQRQGHPDAFCNDARGTIVKVNRTRAVVRWDTPRPSDGYSGEWTWHLDNLLPVDELQGCTLEALASGNGLET